MHSLATVQQFAIEVQYAEHYFGGGLISDTETGYADDENPELFATFDQAAQCAAEMRTDAELGPHIAEINVMTRTVERTASPWSAAAA